MLLDYYQAQAKTTALTASLIDEDYNLFGLCNEAGEVAGVVKKRKRGDTFDYQDALKKELGDVLWYLARVADKAGLRLSDVAQANLNKLADRKTRGVLQGSGDNR